MTGFRPSRVLALVALLMTGCGTGVIPAPVEPTQPADPADIETTIFLIGDAGAPAPAEPVLKALRLQAQAAPAQRVIVFLGDNIYPRGMPPTSDPGRPEAERRLWTQMAIGLETQTPTYFVPGNHDWGYMGFDGWESIKRQGEYIRQNGRRVVQLLPANGCPGPEVVDVGRRVRLIMLDTQWFVHEFNKPADSTVGCATWTPQQVGDSISKAIASAQIRDSVQDEIPAVRDSVAEASDSVQKAPGADQVSKDSAAQNADIATDSVKQVADTSSNREVIVLGHHPMDTSGEHGGHFTFIDQIFPLRRFISWLWIPLPGVGSAEAVARRSGNTNQDMTGPLYARLRRTLDEAFKDHPPLVFAGGHDHDLQVLRGITVKWILVSGAGIYGHLSPVGVSTNTRYSASASGFMRLDVLRDGKVRLGVITVDAAGGSKEAYALILD